MRFSLVLGTFGRYEELARFFESLKVQSYKDFEVILCDQNPPEFLDNLVKKYSDYFKIKHLYCERGLSKARNVGLRVAEGEIIAFPDDDCLYPENLLERVERIFREYPEIDGIAGRAIPLDSGKMDQRFLERKVFVNKENVFFTVVSFTLFLKRSVVEGVGSFDKALGVGSGTPFGSGEEIDYILRALEKGFKILYLPEIGVYHPSKDPFLSGYSREALKRAEAYNLGFAFLLKRYNYPFRFKLRALIWPLLGALYFALKGDFKRVKYQYYKFLGRVKGFLKNIS